MLEVRSWAVGDAADRGWVGRWLERVLQALLLVTAVFALVPFAPLMPGQSLDDSWVYGINQAVAQGLAIGRDIVFTVGPYASIYTGGYHPGTDHLMVFGGLYLGLSLGLALVLATRGRRWYLLAGLWVVLAGLMHSRDALFLAYPLLVAVFCCRSALEPGDSGPGRRWTTILTVILFLPFGLLAAIKGTFLMLGLAVAALAVMLFLTGGRWTLAVAVVASLGVSTPVFWLLAGQSLLDLPQYLRAIVEVSSGYTEAMALPGAVREIVYFLMAASAMLAAIVLERRIPVRVRAFLFLSLLAFLFLAFKGSFVRHDGHATLAGVSLLIGALVLALALQPSRWVPGAVFLALLAWAYIDSHYVNTSTRSLIARFGSTYATAWYGIKNRITTPDRLQLEFQATLQKIQGQARIRPLQGTTDIYAHGQSQLIASGNRWNPRPTFQSYSAYTPALAIGNSRHLIGETAPDNVVFRLEPADDRVPSLDDGASWAQLLTHYRLDAAEHDWLYLRRTPSPAPVADGKVITKGRFSLGDTVPVPDHSAAVFASISIRPTWLGRVMGIVYKPDQLQITVALADGTSRTHRLVSGMARAGFLISPWIQSTWEFGALYGGVDYLAGQEVISFAVKPVGQGRHFRHWEESFDVVLQQAAAVAPTDIRPLSLYMFDRPLEGGAGQTYLAAERCEGGFDSVNGASPAPPSFPASAKLAVHGWMAQSIKPGLVPETVYLVLTDDHGRNLLFRTRRTGRPDVGKYFGEAALDVSGFAATIDVSAIRGDFFLGLAYLDNGRIVMCPRSASRGSFKGVKASAPG